MQAAANFADAFSRATATSAGEESRAEESRRPGADHEALLNALPIASAVIGRTADGGLVLKSYNHKFAQAVDSSTCTVGIQAEEKACLQAGPIADLLTRFFAGERD